MSVLLPRTDPFYAATGDPGRPGDLLRSRPVTTTVDGDVVARQLVYGSTGSRGQATAVSGTVLVPAAPWTGPGPRPIVSYGVGVHGLSRDAAPSYLLRLGHEMEAPLLGPLIARGWAVAVSDGDGHGMPGPHTYGAGRAGGHALLDIVRAAAHLDVGLRPDASLLLWGYSEGGRNACWAAELQPDYAPELVLCGVAAGGVPADLRAVAEAIDGGPFSGLGLAVLVGLAHAHQNPALDAILNEDGRRAAARAVGHDAVGLITAYPEPMRRYTVRDNPWDEPTWRALLADERNGRYRPRAPVYLYHVPDDEIVPSRVARDLVAAYRTLGADVTWAEVAANDHLTGGFVGSRDAVRWLAGRLAASRRPAGSRL
jgi:hypothetical protein